MKKKSEQIVEVVIDKLVHGGQGLGVMPDGRKIFVWNALPGEHLKVRITKSRRDYAEGIAEDIITASPERIEAIDEAYLSTSPWQVMTWQAENTYKKEILAETFAREKVAAPKIEFVAPDEQLHYRNKMEYSFWADDDGLHLALFHRGSHGKRIVSGSSIARPEIDATADKICAILNEHEIRGSQLKTVVVRCNQAGETVAALFIKDEKFPKIDALKSVCKGIVINYSTPKSPASVLTRELYRFGDIALSDTIRGVDIAYDVHSFFQVNLPVFERALEKISVLTHAAPRKVDMYSGVGTIGITIGGTSVLIELDEHNVAMAKRNAQDTHLKIIHASSEGALEYITGDSCLIVDPPRAGLHAKVVDRIIETKPQQIAYLSCNPITQARDLVALQNSYDIKEITGYNFFPRTPHIESLAYLVRK